VYGKLRKNDEFANTYACGWKRERILQNLKASNKLQLRTKTLKRFGCGLNLRIEFFVIQKQKDYKVKYAMAAGLLNIMSNYRTSFYEDEFQIHENRLFEIKLNYRTEF